MLKRMDFKLENVRHVVSAFIDLHMCELYGDNFQEEWTAHSSTYSISPPSPSSTGSAVASDIRDAIICNICVAYSNCHIIY